MKCTKNDRIFVFLSHLRIFKNVFPIFSSIFSVQVSFMNKISKILGIFLKISGLMENPDHGIEFNKATVPNDLDIMRLPPELLQYIGLDGILKNSGTCNQATQML